MNYEFQIGDKVLCIQPDTAVYPIEVGKNYTITNISIDDIWDREYEIENYNKLIFDYYEFSAFFIIDPIYRLKKERKEKLEKLNQSKVLVNFNAS